MSVYKPEPTCRDSMLSEAYVTVLAGPIGSGKSVAKVHRLLQLAAGQQADANRVRKTRALIVRNTADQLALTTRKTVFDWLPPGRAGQWRASEKTFVVQGRLPDGTLLESEWLFIALDTPDDVRKALSLEATFLWGNECRELHMDVVDGLLGRLNRYPSPKDGIPITRSCALFDTNMPDQETPWFEKMEKPPGNWKVFVQPPAIVSVDAFVEKYGHQVITVPTIMGSAHIIDPAAPIFDKDGRAWLVNPAAENLAALQPSYYPNLIPGKTDDWLRVYLRSEYGRSLAGLPVYEKSFVPSFHLASGLQHLRGGIHPIVIGMDFGRNPSAIFKQRDPRGRVLTLGEITTENMGLDRFLTTELKPYLLRRFQGCQFLVAPDPAGYAKQQANEMTLVDQVKAAGLAVVEPHLLTNDPAKRIGAVERLLNQQVDGKAMYLVDEKECPMLSKGFRYGYKYKMKRDGTTESTPEKNEYSHPHDANQYADTVIDMGLRGVALGGGAAVTVQRVAWAT